MPCLSGIIFHLNMSLPNTDPYRLCGKSKTVNIRLKTKKTWSLESIKRTEWNVDLRLKERKYMLNTALLLHYDMMPVNLMTWKLYLVIYYSFKYHELPDC